MYHLRVRTENEAQEEEKRKGRRKKGSMDQRAIDDLRRRDALGAN